MGVAVCSVCMVEPARTGGRCVTCHRYRERKGIERPEETIVRHYQRKVERDAERDIEQRIARARYRIARLRAISRRIEAGER